MTEPFGKARSSAATEALPSGSTRISAAGFGSPPPMRSKPKFPAYARPSDATTMSLRCPVQNSLTSACTLTAPSTDRRRIRWSSIETTSSEPSGSQPIPDGWPSTSMTVSSRPSSDTVTTRWR